MDVGATKLAKFSYLANLEGLAILSLPACICIFKNVLAGPKIWLSS